MRSIHLNSTIGTIAAAAAMWVVPAVAHTQVASQASQVALNDSAARDGAESAEDSHASYKFSSSSDRLSWERARALAAKSTGFRIVVSLQDRHIWAIIDKDTVLSAPAAVAKGTTLEYEHEEWKFTTPRGVRTVLSKEADPIWQPPEWLYAETALEHGLRVGHLNNGQRIKLDDGRILTMRDGYAGVIENGEWGALPTNEHIVFGDVLYVPPMGSANRKIEGELGKYRLNLGDGYLLHGTPYQESIGMAATHGCVRLRDEDIEWLYDHVPVGTKVYIY
ncbi:MAG: L,D-transpeptidase [Gemmatimonadaceae bacterium]